MRYSGVHRAWVVLALAIAAGCANRPTKPLVLTEQVGELPVQFASPHCQIPLLSAPPAQPYEVIGPVTVGDVTVDLGGDGTEIMLGDNAERMEGLGVPPVRDLLAKLRDHAVPVFV